MSAGASPGKPTVVVCGGGIIGCSVAYHLAERGIACTVVERCSIACAASGKAGGFLARDWCDTYELGPLARYSFDQHAKLAEKFGNVDFRRLDTLSVCTKEGGAKNKDELPPWIDGPVNTHYTMGSTANTAQVHPFKLTHAYMQHATDKVGSQVLIGKVEGIEFTDDKTKVTGVKVDGKVIPAEVVVIAMGPWSRQAADWFSIPRINYQRAHSILLRTDTPVSATAVFAEHVGRVGGESVDHEVYPRPDGDVYTCGMSDDHPLPEDPDRVQPNPNSARRLKELCGTLSSHLSSADMYVTQACYLPLSLDSLPMIGPIPEVKGAYVATGHACWGILNSPGTGEMLAEMIDTGSCTVIDPKPFQPARFKCFSKS